MISKAVASGIGVAKEYNAHRNQQKAAAEEASNRSQPSNRVTAPAGSNETIKQASGASLNHGGQPSAAGYEHAPPSAHDSKHQDGDPEDEQDEEAWAIDEMQESEPKDAKDSIKDAKSVQQLLATFSHLHPQVGNSVVKAAMPLPVVLPQRRPRSRERGFVRAYAPVLLGPGIDQTMFFDFLDGFERAIRLHPIFYGINMAVWGTGKALEIVSGPSLTLSAASLAIITTTEGSRRALVIHETNNYLDGMNEILFKPRGLYAMIITYKPNSNKAIEEVKPSNTIEEEVAARNEGAGGKFSRSSGKTHGDFAIPGAAPLVFPQFDAMPEAKKEGMFKDMGHFLTDYGDKRARAKYDYANPESKLAVPSEDFASRFSDPTSPAVRGGLRGLITGGRSPGLRYALKQRRGKDPRNPQPRGARKLLTEDVYYLMIVNMPTEAEMQQALSTQRKAGIV